MSRSARTSFVLATVLAIGCSKPKETASKSDPPAPTAPATGSGQPGATAGSGTGPATATGSDTALVDGQGSGSGSAADPAAAATAQPVGENYLSLASGAYLVAQPSHERAFDHSPINLIFDGMMWRSPETKVTNQVFVIETPGVTTLATIGFDTHHIFGTPEENAKSVLLEASNTSATTGYKAILETTLEAEPKISSYPVSAPVPARWFRLTVKDNYGSASAISLKRIFGYGTQTLAPVPTKMTGTYRQLDAETGKVPDTDDTDLFVKQDGTSVVACWRRAGALTGGFVGTVAPIEWTHPDLGKNGGLVIATRADQLVLWRLKSNGFWALDTFQRFNGDLGPCGDGGSLTGETGLAKDLAETGRAVVYGINFDFNSDRLRDESKAVLGKIVDVLNAHPDWKMRIEGHTDSIGGASFNQTLSEKRATAVVAYLTRAKISADRLAASGSGLTSPIDSNDTDVGRARNRRVELVKQ